MTNNCIPADCTPKGCALNGWPFKYINGEQTPESKALEALPPEKPLKGYDLATCETNEEALL